MKVKYAEDVGHYWKTGKSTPDTWIDKTTSMIRKDGGKLLAEGFLTTQDRAAFMIEFQYGDDKFKIVFPVLQPKKDSDILAARRQAATALYYDVKAKIVLAKFLGYRTAFFAHMQLSDGRVMAEVSEPELLERVPTVLLLTGEIVE